MKGDLIPGRLKSRAVAVVAGCVLSITVMIGVSGACLVRGRKDAGVARNADGCFAVFSPVSGTSCACGSPAENPTDEGQAEGFMVFGRTLSNLMPDAFAAAIKDLSSVSDVSTFLGYRFKDPRDGRVFTVGGLDLGRPQAAGTAPCSASDVTTGRFLSAGNPGTVLLMEDYARSLGLKVGDTIIISDRTFIVAGTVDAAILPARTDIYMQRAEVELLIAGRLPDLPVSGQSNLILVKARSVSARDRAIRDVKALYPDLLISHYE